MPRAKKVTVGDVVQFVQVRNGELETLPMMVTHVHLDDVISGVAFSGEPGAIGWMGKGAQPFNLVTMGFNNKQWSHVGTVASELDEGGEEGD